MAEQPPLPPEHPTPEGSPAPQPTAQPTVPFSPPPGGYTPPPGFMPPPGYGAQQQQPPPGYPAYPQGYAQPGYAQPGYYPPGNVPPGYYPEYPAPREYATPPVNPGLPWQIAPGKDGSLIQAWLSIAVNLSRQNIASWAAGCKRGWIAKSIATYITLGLLPIIVFAFAGPPIILNAFTNAGQVVSPMDEQILTTSFIIGGFGAVILTPLLVFGSIVNTAFFWALFMPQHLGTLRDRMRRALRPYALTLPIMGFFVFLVLSVMIPFMLYFFGSFFASAATANTATGSAPPANLSPVIAFVPLFDLVFLGLSVYTYALQIQSGSVGSTLNRWAVFGIMLLAGFAYTIAIYILELIVFFIIGMIIAAHQTSGIHLLPTLHALAGAFH